MQLWNCSGGSCACDCFPAPPLCLFRTILTCCSVDEHALPALQIHRIPQARVRRQEHCGCGGGPGCTQLRWDRGQSPAVGDDCRAQTAGGLAKDRVAHPAVGCSCQKVMRAQ